MSRWRRKEIEWFETFGPLWQHYHQNQVESILGTLPGPAQFDWFRSSRLFVDTLTHVCLQILWMYICICVCTCAYNLANILRLKQDMHSSAPTYMHACIAFHLISFHFIYIILQDTTLHYTTSRYITLQYLALDYTTSIHACTHTRIHAHIHTQTHDTCILVMIYKHVYKYVYIYICIYIFSTLVGESKCLIQPRFPDDLITEDERQQALKAMDIARKKRLVPLSS